MPMQERRNAQRFPMALHGCAVINGNPVEIKTQDVSQGGALVKFVTHTCLKTGTKLLLRFNFGFFGRAIICRIVTRDNRTMYGLKFDRFDSYSDLLLIAYLIRHEQHPPGV